MNQDFVKEAIPSKTVTNTNASTKKQMPCEASDLEEGQVDENKLAQNNSIPAKDASEKPQNYNKKDPKVIYLRTRERQAATKLIHKLVVKTAVSSEDESNQLKDNKTNDKPSTSEVPISKDDPNCSKESTKPKLEDEEGQVLSLDQYIQKNKTPQLDAKQQRSTLKYSSTTRVNVTLSDIQPDIGTFNGLRYQQQQFRGNLLPQLQQQQQLGHQAQLRMDQQQVRVNAQNLSGKDQYYYGAPQLKGTQSYEQNTSNDISDSQSLKVQKQFLPMSRYDSQQNQRQYYLSQVNSREERQSSDSKLEMCQSQEVKQQAVPMQNLEQPMDLISTSASMPILEQGKLSLNKQLSQQIPIPPSSPPPPPPPPSGTIPDNSLINRRDSSNVQDQPSQGTSQWQISQQGKNYTSSSHNKSFITQNTTTSYKNGYKNRTFNTNTNNDRSNKQKDYQHRSFINRNTSNSDNREQSRDQRSYYSSTSNREQYQKLPYQHHQQEKKEQQNSYSGLQTQREHSREDGKRESSKKICSPIHVPEMHSIINVRQGTRNIDMEEEDPLDNYFRVRPINCQLSTRDDFKNDGSSPKSFKQIKDASMEKQSSDKQQVNGGDSTRETSDLPPLRQVKSYSQNSPKGSVDEEGSSKDNAVQDIQKIEQEPSKYSSDKARLHRQIHQRIQEVKRRSQRQNQHKYHTIYRFHSLHATENKSDENLKQMDFSEFSKYFRSKLERSSSSSLEREFCIINEGKSENSSKDSVNEKQGIDRSRSREKKASKRTEAMMNNSDLKREQTPQKVADILRDVQEYHSDESESSKHIKGSTSNTAAKATTAEMRTRLDRQSENVRRITSEDKQSKFEEDNQIDYDFDP